MSVTEELEAQLARLSDPKVHWVKRSPNTDNESCLVMWYGTDFCELSKTTSRWLDMFVYGYAYGLQPTKVCPWENQKEDTHSDIDLASWAFGRALAWNDSAGIARNDVLLMLDEAVEQARWEGV